MRPRYTLQKFAGRPLIYDRVTDRVFAYGWPFDYEDEAQVHRTCYIEADAAQMVEWLNERETRKYLLPKGCVKTRQRVITHNHPVRSNPRPWYLAFGREKPIQTNYIFQNATGCDKAVRKGWTADDAHTFNAMLSARNVTIYFAPFGRRTRISWEASTRAPIKA
jgi:hypothetical protein